jgi:hypothetical protein
MTSSIARIAGLALAALTVACSPEPDFEPPRQVVYLDQGERWNARNRALFYYTPQGTLLHDLRYSWLQHLEVSKGQRLADPAYLSKFGFIYAPEQFDPNYDGGDLNPGNFPVGFAKHRDELTGDSMLDITCAACHTGQLDYKGLSLRVDGGQPMHGLAWIRLKPPGQFVITLVAAMATTYLDPMKFDRFAEAVLGTRYPYGKAELRVKLKESIGGFLTEGVSTFTLSEGELYMDHGYGRLDALGRIADTVFGEDIDPRNDRVTDAPVSYPHLWDIWKFDWVQWNGSVAQPMGRNVSQSLGVKARLDLVDEQGNALPPDEIYDSSVLLREQHCVETTLWQLGPPRWPEDIFPPIDRARVLRGKALFSANCQGCHGPHVYSDEHDPKLPIPETVRYDCQVHPNERKPSPDKPVEWKMCVVPTWDIGTDPRVVNNFLDQRYDLSALDFGDPKLRETSSAAALLMLMNAVSDRKIDELDIGDDLKWEMQGWGRENAVRDMRGYKSRPLHGIWATPPFLHNGSVRTLYQMLSPQPQRETKIWVGSREFDPVNVGYTNEKTDWAYELDTSEPGNHNTGHQFTDAGGVGVIGPELAHEERLDLIEYLKALGNPKYDPDYEEYAAPWAGAVRCPTDLQGPAAHRELVWPN